MRKPIDQGTLYHELAKYLPYKAVADHYLPGISLAMDLRDAVMGLKDAEALRCQLIPFGARMETLIESMVMSDVADITHDLVKVGEAHDAAFILKYCSDLRQLANAFDVHGLRAQIKLFKKILQALEGKI